MRLPLLLTAICLFFFSSSSSARAQTNAPPPPPREFRAAWVATLDNIDWPSARNLPPAAQRAEIRQLLDAAAELKLNAIILQVRTAADALYPSSIEPWSQYLTGTQGSAPQPPWDPLAVWIEEAHNRGIELHAWLNPCRALVGTSRPAANHISRTHPELLVRYDKFLWFDPGNPAAVEHILAVFADVTRRYDIDGIHVDDYFYPYPVQKDGHALPFPDDESWQRYSRSSGPLNRDDWRRQNVNNLVRQLHQQTHSLKPGIRFGISPFGISRPGVAPGITGFDQFTGIYADPALWLREGWCDYLAPQLYWPISQKAQSFPVLLESWHRQNPRAIPIWPGLYTSKLITPPNAAWTAPEILAQIQLCRAAPQPPGHIHFSFRALLENRLQIADQLKSNSYKTHALLPAVSNPPVPPPVAPNLEFDSAKTRLDILPPASGTSPDSTPPRILAAWFHNGKDWDLHTQPAFRHRLFLPPKTTAVAAFTVDRWGQTSPLVNFEVK
jgi:uncharacterized lipoprotein YddW (UPF0748 family)